MPVRVVIVEDDHVTRESLAALVREEPGLELIAVYPDGESAVQWVPQCAPDVAVVDMGLCPPGSGRLDGAGCVAALKRKLPDLRALMLTVYDDHDVIVRSLRAGASGYILKRSPPDEILAAIKVISQGGTPLSMLVAMQLVNAFHDGDAGPPAAAPGGAVPIAAAPPATDPAIAGLAPVELEILAELARGVDVPDIASRTGLPVLAVRSYMHSIFAQLGVQTSAHAVARYLENGGDRPPS